MSKSFKDVKEVVVLVDFSNQVYRSHFATERDGLINSDKINVGCIIGFCKTLNFSLSQAKKISAMPKLVIAEDSRPTRKRNLYAKFQSALSSYRPDKNWDGVDAGRRISYKGNRESKELGYDPLEICRQFMECIPSTTIKAEGEEADDVIASFVAQNPNKTIHLYSTDKDMWQLLKKFSNLSIFLTGDEQPSSESCLKHFKTSDFSRIPLHKTICGDSGDNVKSLFRYPFSKTLDVFLECDGTPENYLKLLIEKYGEDHKYSQHFLSFLGVAILNWQVVQLRYDLTLEAARVKEPLRERWGELCRRYETPSLTFSPLVKIF
jgi:5'-3' exonuclease